MAWALAEDEISSETIDAALPLVKEGMRLQVHSPALRGVPERELEYLVLMANRERPVSTGIIAEALGIPANQQSIYRRRLIELGLIAPAGYGHVDFALPYLGEYLREREV